MRPALKLAFHQPTRGYWDGGARQYGAFTPDWPHHNYRHPGPGQRIKWGSLTLNFWFKAGSGRTWKQAARIAQRKLARLVRVPATVTIIDTEDPK